MMWSIIQGLIRHGLTGLGGVVIAKGYADDKGWEDVVGALMLLIGAAHSAYVKWKASQPKDPVTIAQSPKGVSQN